MPAKCPWCEAGTHSDVDVDEYPICERKFLTASEAWHIIAEENPSKDEIHVFMNPRADLLVGADWSRNAIKDLLSTARHIELCDANGRARAMKHGICLVSHEGESYFIETDEKLLKAYEEFYCGK